MFIASQLRKQNIVEYLLYMWQIEDLIRAYGLDIDYVIKTILESLSESSLTYIRTTPEKAPKVRMTSMGASSIDFELLVWISENPDENGIGSSNMSDFLIFVYKTLQTNNIEIPFPQMDIHLRKAL